MVANGVWLQQGRPADRQAERRRVLQGAEHATKCCRQADARHRLDHWGVSTRTFSYAQTERSR